MSNFSGGTGSKSDIGLGNVTNDAQLKRDANDINTFAEKENPVDQDILLIEDSADGYAKKKILVGDLPGGSGTDANAIHKTTAGEINGVSFKETPVIADILLIEDSADGYAKKKILVGDLPFGGLVPVRKDGVEIVSTPAAFNFIGSGMKVTNVGGSANVEVAGAEGVEGSKTSDVAETITGVESPSWGPTLVSDLTQTVSVAEGERVLVVFGGWASMPSSGVASANAYLYIDDLGTQGNHKFRAHATLDTIYYGYQLSSAYLTDPLTAGSHTFRIYCSKYASSEVSWSLTDSYLHLIRYRGGYVQPENLPVLEYNSASVVNVKAPTGMDTEMRVQLNDGKQRRYTGTRTIDLTISGRGGLDTGTEAVSTWYYAYAVPSAASDDVLDVLCSVTPPTTGPTGYPVWRYLGAFYNKSDGNIQNFFQRGDDFHVNSPGISLGTDADGSPVSLSLADYIPATASEVITDLMIQPGAGPAYVDAWPDGLSGGAGWTEAYAGTVATQQLVCRIPTTSTRTVYYKKTGASISFCYWIVNGWKDGYLSTRASQTQAKYVPDTKLAKGTWATATTVNFAASPGQPSTVRLTSKQDNKQRTFTGTLAWAVANGVADLGYDEAASQGNSKWLYWYLVPKTGDDSLWSARASDNDPSVGPTGYSNWIYCWSSYIDGSGNLIKAYQNGNTFTLQYSVDKTVTMDNTARQLSLSTELPYTAGQVIVCNRCSGNGTVSLTLYCAEDENDSGAGAFSLAILSGEHSVSGDQFIPTPATSKAIGYYGYKTDTAEGHVYVRGWIDDYLAGGVI